MQISVQLRPWLIQNPAPPLTDILNEAKKVGFAGVEIGAHYLDWDNPGALRSALERNGLRLSGVHIGGDIFNPTNVRRVRAAIEKVAECTVALGASYLLFSGLMVDENTPVAVEQEAQVVQQAAQVGRQFGLQLLYHNHWWEIEQDFAYLRYLLANTDPALVCFCLDLGWTFRAGGDPLYAVDLLGSRARYYHLRDDSPQKIWKGLGEGAMDLIPLLEKVEARQPAWVAIEQDDISGPVAEAVGSSRRFLKDHMNW